MLQTRGCNMLPVSTNRIYCNLWVQMVALHARLLMFPIAPTEFCRQPRINHGSKRSKRRAGIAEKK